MEILELPIWLTMSLVFQSRKLRSILHSFLPPPNPDWSPSLVGCVSHSLHIVLLTFFYPSYGAHYLPSHLLVWLLHSPHHPSITPPWCPVAQVKFSSQRTRLFSDWLALLWISPHSPGRDSGLHIARLCTPTCLLTAWCPLNTHPVFSSIVSSLRAAAVSASSAAVSPGTWYLFTKYMLTK